MSESQPESNADKAKFDKLIASAGLDSYEDFNRISNARETLDNHNNMVMTEIVRMTIDFHEDSIEEVESIMINNIFYFHEYARELSRMSPTRQEKRYALSQFIYHDNADKIEQLSRLLGEEESFIPVVTQSQILSIMNQLNLECGGDEAVIAARTYRGLTSYYFNKYCAEAFDVGP